jgi:hypothetical protein
MFKAIKEFFTGKKEEAAAAAQAPYKVETPVVEIAERLSAPAVEAKKASAPKSKKPSGARKPAAAKKPAAKKPTPTP